MNVNVRTMVQGLVAVLLSTAVCLPASADIMVRQSLKNNVWSHHYWRAGNYDFSDQRCALQAGIQGGLLRAEFPVQKPERGEAADNARVVVEFSDPVANTSGKPKLTIQDRTITMTDVSWNEYKDVLTFTVKDEASFRKRFAQGSFFGLKLPGRKTTRYKLTGTARAMKVVDSCQDFMSQPLRNYRTDPYIAVSARNWNLRYEAGNGAKAPSCTLRNFESKANFTLVLEAEGAFSGGAKSVSEDLSFFARKNVRLKPTASDLRVDGKVILANEDLMPLDIPLFITVRNKDALPTFKERLAAGNRLALHESGKRISSISLKGSSKALKYLDRCVRERLTKRVEEEGLSKAALLGKYLSDPETRMIFAGEY